MVKTLYGLSEGTFPKEIQDFKPESKMIAQNYRVITLLIIIAKVVVFTRFALYFYFWIHIADEVNSFVVKDLCFLVVS